MKVNATENCVKQVAERQTTRLGDLVAAVFDEASRLTSDPSRSAQLAAAALGRILATLGDRRIVRLLSAAER
jgi:hypothetical protein